MEKKTGEETTKKEGGDKDPDKQRQSDVRSNKQEENTNNKDADNKNSNSPKTSAAKMNDEKQDEKESTEELKVQLNTLMNSLATLSAEKSKMEANFQTDKKQLRNERDECEKVIKDLKEKLKKAQTNNHSEIEHIKCKLIMERQEREKEQAEQAALIKEIQRLLNEERRTKEQLEAQLKMQFSHKTQCKILEAELEITKNKLKQAEQAAKETPPLLISLQAEMAAMKKQHRSAIHDEQKRASAAEQQTRTLAMAHETRVVGLEARLAELSEIVGSYDRLRQQDQSAIQKLKEELATLRDTAARKEFVEPNIPDNPEELVSMIKRLFNCLVDLDNKDSNSSYVKSLANSLDLCNSIGHSEYKEKYEALLQEFEDYKRQVSNRYNIKSDVTRATTQTNKVMEDSHGSGNNKTQLHLLQTHNANLEERIRMLKNREIELQMHFDHRQKILQEERCRIEQTLIQKENGYRSKIATLEQQLLRQRERSMTLVEEKDKEISRLKASLHALLPNHDSLPFPFENRAYLSKYNEKPPLSPSGEPIADAVKELFVNDSPPILHYTQELARKEVQVANSRKRILELEACLREKQREILRVKEKQKEESKSLQSQITRLEACKSREGANLEYLKNVIINYLTTNDASSKRHMLNAISTVLRFTPDEFGKIKHSK